MTDILDVPLDVEDATLGKFDWQIAVLFGVSAVIAVLAIIGACDVYVRLTNII